jgi:hypothetical protein
VSHFTVRSKNVFSGISWVQHTYIKSDGFCCGCPDHAILEIPPGSGCGPGDDQGSNEWFSFEGIPAIARCVAGPGEPLINAGVLWGVNGVCHHMATRLAVAGGANLNSLWSAGLAHVGGYWLSSLLWGRVGTWIPGTSWLTHIWLAVAYASCMGGCGASAPELADARSTPEAFNLDDMARVIAANGGVLTDPERQQLLDFRIAFAKEGTDAGPVAPGDSLAIVSRDGVAAAVAALVTGAVAVIGSDKFIKLTGVDPEAASKLE